MRPPNVLRLRLVLAALVALAVPAAACPCMDGLPALGHNPEGVALPVRAPEDPGCQATASDRAAAMGLVEVIADDFSNRPREPGWFTFPAGEGGPRWSQGPHAMLAGPGASRTAVVAAARLDGVAWTAGLNFRLGSGDDATDPLGTGGFAVQTLILFANGTLSEGPRLDVGIDNRGPGEYDVTAPEASGLRISDGVAHALQLRQAGGRLHVLLDGTEVDDIDAIGGAEDCVLVGIAGPKVAGDLPVRVDDVVLTTVRNEAALQALRYGYSVEVDLPGIPGMPACGGPERACCFIEPISDNWGQSPCSATCHGEEIWLRPVEDPRVPPALGAARSVHEQFGCVPDLPDRSLTATFWPVGPGLNEEMPKWALRSGALRATTTDLVMYDEQGSTRFSCDLIGGEILIQFTYSEEEARDVGDPDRLRVQHWDGHKVRTLEKGVRADTDLGRLVVHDAGNDVANRTVWATVSLTEQVDGRALNNNFATMKLSDDRVEGNGYALGIPRDRDVPALPILAVVVALALVAAARREL